MDKFIIHGPTPLNGSVSISGAKNAAVAIIPAAILSDGVCRIENIPQISDVTNCLRILYEMGAGVKTIDSHTVEIDPSTIHTCEVPRQLAQRMRASYYFLGALLGKSGTGRVALPGGCDLGPRPMDLHLDGFAALGAKCVYAKEDASQTWLQNGQVDWDALTLMDPEKEKGAATAVVVSANRLTGAHIYLNVASVGATMNIMMAAVKARGLTIIENAAKEPHIVDLAIFLNSMGADIRGAGTNTIKINGVERLKGTTHSIIPDQIEAGTFMVAAAATGGDVLVENVIPKHLESMIAKLSEIGVEVSVSIDEASVRVKSQGKWKSSRIKTAPHPGFPTDMQPQFGVLLALAQGEKGNETGAITEGIWDNRFRYTNELNRMGASISVSLDGKTATFHGVEGLHGARVRANDLRAGAAMMIAAMAANGITEIEDIHYIERGYEQVVEKFAALGAKIQRVSLPTDLPK